VNIERIDLYTNEIGGTIPDILNLLPKLKNFDIEDNNMVGSVSVELPPDIQSFRVSLNEFTGEFPSLSELSNLTDLWCADNQLTGNFLSGATANLPNLKSLVIYGNNFNGPLPTGFSKLEKFLAQDNSFTSTIPPDLFQNTFLQELRLDKNTLTGTIPSEIGNLLDLKDLRLGENVFTGRLPPEIARLSNLGKFCLYIRSFHASIKNADSFVLFFFIFYIRDSAFECYPVDWSHSRLL
jgi:Leucine-rich repeat (LRR) protein